MPEEKKLPDEEQVIKSPEVTDTADGGVEVSVDEPTTQPQEEIVQPKKVEKEVSKEDALKNKVYAQDRIINKMRQELEEVRTIASTYQTKEQQIRTDAKLDELDELAQKDWKAAVSKVAEVKAREVYNMEQAKIKEQQTTLQTQDELRRNIQTVESKYPDLNDPASEKALIFQSILDKNPSWRTNNLGPLLTMYQMEEELKKKGYDVGDTTDTKKEIERVSRISSTSLSPTRSSPSPSKVVLTREQKDFCDSNGIPYTDYARTLRSGGGVEI